MVVGGVSLKTNLGLREDFCALCSVAVTVNSLVFIDHEKIV